MQHNKITNNHKKKTLTQHTTLTQKSTYDDCNQMPNSELHSPGDFVRSQSLSTILHSLKISLIKREIYQAIIEFWRMCIWFTCAINRMVRQVDVTNAAATYVCDRGKRERERVRLLSINNYTNDDDDEDEPRFRVYSQCDFCCCNVLCC